MIGGSSSGNSWTWKIKRKPGGSMEIRSVVLIQRELPLPSQKFGKLDQPDPNSSCWLVVACPKLLYMYMYIYITVQQITDPFRLWHAKLLLFTKRLNVGLCEPCPIVAVFFWLLGPYLGWLSYSLLWLIIRNSYCGPHINFTHHAGFQAPDTPIYHMRMFRNMAFHHWGLHNLRDLGVSKLNAQCPGIQTLMGFNHQFPHWLKLNNVNIFNHQFPQNGNLNNRWP